MKMDGEKSLIPYEIAYPIIFGIIPAVFFFILKNLEMLSGFTATVLGIGYFALYIPFSIWLINRNFKFKIRSIKILFWIPYLFFSLMCLTFVFSIGLIALSHFLTGELPHYMLAGGITIPAVILSIFVLIAMIKMSNNTQGVNNA